MANGFKVDNAPGAPGINIWSRGPIYPLVIARKERIAVRTSGEHIVKWYDVLNADDDMAGFASYDDALAAARGWLEANKPAPAAVLSPFNPAAFDAELADDYEAELMRDLYRDHVYAMGGA